MQKWLFTLAAVFWAANVSFAQADAVKTILDKAIKAHGGKELLAKYPASKSTFNGEMTLMGMNIDIEAIITGAPGKMKTELVMTVQGQKIEILQVTDGKKVKMQAKVGGMKVDQPLTEAQQDEIKHGATTHEMSQLVPLFNAKKYELTAEADEDVEKKKAEVVSVKIIEHGKTVKLFFDKESHLLVKTSHEGLLPGGAGDKKGMLESVYSDYKKVDGMMQPMKIVASADGAVYLTAKVGEVKNLEKIDDKEFAIDD